MLMVDPQEFSPFIANTLAGEVDMSTVRRCLALAELQDAVILAGSAGLDRPVRMAHVVDIPEVGPWICPELLLLTTGHGRGEDAEDWIQLIKELDQQQVAGIFIAFGRYVNQLPETVLIEADHRGLPIVKLPWSLPFIRVSEAVHRLIIEEHTEVVVSIEQIQTQMARAALSSRTITDLIVRLSRLGLIKMALYDETHTLVAGQPHLLEPLKAISVPLERGVHYTLRVEDRGTVSPLAEYAALVLGLYLLREQVAARTEAKLQSSLVNALLRHEALDDPELLQRARLLGFHTESPHALLVLDLPKPPTDQESSRQWVDNVTHAEQLLAAGLKDFSPLTTTRHNSLVTVLGPLASRDVDHCKSGLQKFFHDFPRSSGILTEAIATKELAGMYDVVESLLPLAPKGQISPLTHLIFPQIVASLPDSLMASYWAATWGRLTSASLRDSLATLTKHHGHIQEAALQLGIHRNTLRHRIEQIEHILQRPLTPDFLNELALAWTWGKTRQLPDTKM